MRLIYLDSALADRVGHHSNYCGLITGEAKSRGLTVATFGRREIAADLAAELGVTPLFRWGTYHRMHTDRDPISGWLRDFELAWKTTLEDLRPMTPIRSDDVVYFSSAQPAQFMAIVQWLWQLPAGDRPRVTVEFGTEPGLQSVRVGGKVHYEVPDPRRDARAVFYHHVATLLQPSDLARLRLVTFDAGVSAIYQGLLGVPVGTIPLPLSAATSGRSRKGRRPIVISCLGHQRPDKGYQFVPAIVEQLRDLNGVSFLIHNAAPNEMREPQEALRRLAADRSNVMLDEAPAAGARWAGLLDASDLVVCPYEPDRYASSYSAVLAECLANGIPTVLPAGTRLAALSREFGGASVDFTDWTADSIAAAIRRAVTEFDGLADRAAGAATRWAALHGPARVVDALLNPSR